MASQQTYFIGASLSILITAVSGCNSSNKANSAPDAGGLSASGGTGQTGVHNTGGAGDVGGFSSIDGGSGTGGSTSTGGVINTGGISNIGGATTGSALAAGGMSSASSSIGGASSTGGVSITGGVSSTGGVASSGTTGTAKSCLVNGKQVPNEALAYYDKCNACYCSQGGIWCNAVSCPAPGSSLYSCPDTLVKLTYGNIGGNALYQDSSTMDPTAWTYTHTRTYANSTLQSLTCTVPMPICYSGSGTVLNNLKTDLATTEVGAALALATPPLLGNDPRPVDGTVFSILRSDGHGILVGGTCPSTGSGSCNPIPANVQKLVDDLKYLDRQILELQSPPLADCAVFSR
jgi:hypothetical protein